MAIISHSDPDLTGSGFFITVISKWDCEILFQSPGADGKQISASGQRCAIVFVLRTVFVSHNRYPLENVDAKISPIYLISDRHLIAFPWPNMTN